MKLSISNIIWEKGKENFENFLKLIVKNEIYAVELSLSSIFDDPHDITKDELSWLKSLLKSYSISVSSLHSLTYTRPDLEIFNSKLKRKELIEYTLRYIELARKLDTVNLVYGSPKSRKKYDNEKTNLDILFLEFLSEIDRYSDGMCFNIEPLPKQYCEYLNTFQESVEFLEIKDFKNIYIQLDTRSIIESNENIDEIFSHSEYIKHVHVGEPGLIISDNKYSGFHNIFREKLIKMSYNNYVSIEIINKDQTNFEEYLELTVKRVRKYYG